MMSNLAQVHRAFLFKKCPNTSMIQRGLYSSKNVTIISNEPQSHIEGISKFYTESTNNTFRRRHEDHHLSKTKKSCEIGCQPNSSNINVLLTRVQNYEDHKLKIHEVLRNVDFLRQSADRSNGIATLSTPLLNRSKASLCTTTTSTSYDNEIDSRERQKFKHWKSEKSRKSKSKLFWSLAVLGVFKRMTTDDIVEEKKKLADEEKVKKMTPAELLIAKGVLFLCDFEYDKAEDLFHKALHLAQEDQNEEQETLVLNLLATNYFESGQFDQAEKLFIDLIKRLIAQEMEPSDPAILELSLKLSSIYSKNVMNHTKAFKGFEFVINSLLYSLQDLLKDLEQIDVLDLSEQQRNDLALLGWTYDWFARHLMAMNDYVSAVDMLRRALDISTKILGPKHDQTLILLNDVGTTLAMINKAEEGRNYIKRAVEGALESQSRELASFYVNLGLVNLQLRKLDEAKRYCEYSIELASKNTNQQNTSEILNLSQNCLNEVKRLLQVQTNQ